MNLKDNWCDYLTLAVVLVTCVLAVILLNHGNRDDYQFPLGLHPIVIYRTVPLEHQTMDSLLFIKVEQGTTVEVETAFVEIYYHLNGYSGSAPDSTIMRKWGKAEEKSKVVTPVVIERKPTVPDRRGDYIVLTHCNDGTTVFVSKWTVRSCDVVTNYPEFNGCTEVWLYGQSIERYIVKESPDSVYTLLGVK